MFFVRVVKSVAASYAGPDRYDCDRPSPAPGGRILAAAASNLPSASERLPSSQRFALSQYLETTHVYIKVYRINIRKILVAVVQHSTFENTGQRQTILSKVFLWLSSVPLDKRGDNKPI
jgi:hypothetical protein